ncbi:hypothetical protein FRACA_750020 [Frankia canadensis]|uniref:Uncharacterized protein n=1 Tax=Frankia canadensis TaxID=1836972 RepID=A0A2I2L106_9ACTN|nr:hypothetical protein FRACA_750020 [Frankia canadensis]SOU58875.1 hypothetical protein FRACA_750020 [Frankia canadensis]
MSSLDDVVQVSAESVADGSVVSSAVVDGPSGAVGRRSHPSWLRIAMWALRSVALSAKGMGPDPSTR